MKAWSFTPHVPETLESEQPGGSDAARNPRCARSGGMFLAVCRYLIVQPIGTYQYTVTGEGLQPFRKADETCKKLGRTVNLQATPAPTNPTGLRWQINFDCYVPYAVLSVGDGSYKIQVPTGNGWAGRPSIFRRPTVTRHARFKCLTSAPLRLGPSSSAATTARR